MIESHRLRGTAYCLVAGAALLATASQLGSYLPLGIVQGNVKFWGDTLANPASRFITADIFFVFLMVWHWMLGEARRLNMRGIGRDFAGPLFIPFHSAERPSAASDASNGPPLKRHLTDKPGMLREFAQQHGSVIQGEVVKVEPRRHRAADQAEALGQLAAQGKPAAARDHQGEPLTAVQIAPQLVDMHGARRIDLIDMQGRAIVEVQHLV